MEEEEEQQFGGGGWKQAEAPEKHSALLRETTLSPSFTLNHLLSPQISQS